MFTPDKRKEEKSMMNFAGSCKWCGQITNSNREFSTQEEANKYASEHCDCETARLEKYKRDQIYYGMEKVEHLFGENATDFGFEPANEDVIEFLNMTIETMVNGVVNAVTLKIAGGDKAVIALTNKGGVKVQRSKVQQCQLTD